MKAVLDTNVLVSAYVFPGGSPEMVLRHALEGRLELLTSVALIGEFARVLVEKFGWDQSRADDIISQVVALATIVEPREAIQVVEDDPDDDRVLEAAVEGGADAIVSGDRHLLRLSEWRGIRILTPAPFLEEFQ